MRILQGHVACDLHCSIRLLASFLLVFIPSSTSEPNIIVMQADDLPQYTEWTPAPNAFYGQLPSAILDGNLERLRKASLEMRLAYTSSSSCAPSRFSTMTGRYPSRSATSRMLAEQNNEEFVFVNVPRTKLEDVDNNLDCTEDNIAVTLQANGYRTGFFGKWHLHREHDNDNYAESKMAVENCGFHYADSIYMDNMRNLGDGALHNMEWVADNAIKFIYNNVSYPDGLSHENEPFFMYFNPTIPHQNRVQEALRSGSCTNTNNGEQPEPHIVGMNGDLSCREYRETVLNRASEMSNTELGAIWLDDSVGALIHALEVTNQLSNTIFLFQMDHGEAAKFSVFEGGNRISQFIHYPDLFGNEGLVFEGLVSTIDIVPTMLDFAGAEPSSFYTMDGKSWKDLVQDGMEWKNRCLFFESDFDRALICGCYKLIYLSTGEKYLYDLCNEGNYIHYDPNNPNFDPEVPERSIFDSSDKTESMVKALDCFMEKTRVNNTGTDEYNLQECTDLVEMDLFDKNDLFSSSYQFWNDLFSCADKSCGI